MIVVDSSALIAIFEAEPDAASFAAAIMQADRLLISAVNVHETGMVLRVRHGDAATARLWRFLKDNDFEIVPFDENQAREADAAVKRFGKGIDPKARLNLADCAAYALAKSMNVPLLFKGDDFTHTDVQICRTVTVQG
jgi:ribonuclease VapC